MENNKGYDKWVEDAMNSLDGMNRVEANPFLYGKIQSAAAGFSKRQNANGFGMWMYSLALAMVILIIVNVYSFSSFVNGKSIKGGQTGIEAFANDYNINSSEDNI